MSPRRPTRFQIVGPRVLGKLQTAPPHVRETFHRLIEELEVGPYPDQHPDVAEARGSAHNHLYVAWKDGVHVMYFIMQDQPVVSLVGVHWRTDPDGGDDGRPEQGPEPEPQDWMFSLAA